jgi:hypothetical protein
MKESYGSKTGNAPIVRQGHTATTKHGSDPNLKVRGGNSPRDLKK